jgi:multicomponent Na+:H+ antiporter subunit E
MTHLANRLATHLGLVALLVALWILAWGQLTLANVASGVVVAVGLLVAFPPRRRRGPSDLRLSAVGLARLAAYVVSQLVISNVVMTRQILRRDTARRPGVVAHRLAQPSEEVATLVSSVIALSPGTMTVDVESDASVLYVHFFALHDVAGARTSLARLERHVIDAIAARSEPDGNGTAVPKESP